MTDAAAVNIGQEQPLIVAGELLAHGTFEIVPRPGEMQKVHGALLLGLSPSNCLPILRRMGWDNFRKFFDVRSLEPGKEVDWKALEILVTDPTRYEGAKEIAYTVYLSTPGKRRPTPV